MENLNATSLIALGGLTPAKACTCPLRACAAWERFTEDRWPKTHMQPVGTLRDEAAYQPSTEEHHPKGTRYASADAPVAVNFFPFFPRLPVRQWVLSVPKRLRYFMQRDGAVLNLVLPIFLRVIEQSLQFNSPGAAQVSKATLHIGAIAFIHRFSSDIT